MIRLPLSALLCAAVLGLGASRLAAQAEPANAPEPIPAPKDSAPAEKSDANPKVFNSSRPGTELPSPALAPLPDYHGDPPRISSTELAGALASSLPAYNPPAPPAEKKPEAAPQPKNGIVRLPTVTVREKKNPVFTEKQLYAPDSLNDIQIHRYVGLDPAKMPGVAAPITRFMFQDYAAQMQSDADRQQGISDTNDMARAAALSGGPGESEYIKRVSNDTFMRDSSNTPDQGPNAHGMSPYPSR